jgi:hypothetical protein
MDNTNTNPTFVRVMMSKTEESRAVLATLADLQDPPQVRDKKTYWQVEDPDEIIIDVDRVGDHLGRDIEIDDLLADFVTYVGRVDIDDQRIRVTAQFLQVKGGA